MSHSFDATNQLSRYAPLGLIANPFFGVDVSGSEGEDCEVTSESNCLLRGVLRAAAQDAPKPIWVTKDDFIPDSFCFAAQGRVQRTMAGDDGSALLHAYIPLFGMRSGAVRSALMLLSERLVYRDVDKTIAAYVENVLAEPDTALPSYQALGPDALGAFAEAFAEDQLGTIRAVFGEPEMERQLEIAEIADVRQLQFDGDEESPDDDIAEVDETVGDAPGTHLLESAEDAPADEGIAVGFSPKEIADYVIDYTREHLSPVVGRAIRVYRDRGLSAMAAEFNITKSPRKTLAAVARFARVRYRKLVFIWDGFDNWLDIEPDLRSKIVSTLLELRWMLADDGVIVSMAKAETAPELEEAFSSGEAISWTFPGFQEMAEDPDLIRSETIDRWLANAAVPDGAALAYDSPALSPIVEAAGGSLVRFIKIAAEAIEEAADAGASSIDPEHVARAIEAVDSAEQVTEE